LTADQLSMFAFNQGDLRARAVSGQDIQCTPLIRNCLAETSH
jgi:hypothetical protein